MCGRWNVVVNSKKETNGGAYPNMQPHDEFLELCAVSTSGDLSQEEQNKLNAHLAGCAECRQALKEFEVAVEVGLPLLSSRLSGVGSDEFGSFRKNFAEQSRLESPGAISSRPKATVQPGFDQRGFAFAKASARSRVNWGYLWMSFAACIVLTIALGIYGSRMGVGPKPASGPTTSVLKSDDARIQALEQSISDAGQERERLHAQLADRDKLIADLRHRTADDEKSLDAMKTVEGNLEQSLQASETEKQQVADERTSLTKKFDAAVASLQKVQSELNLAKRQQEQARADDASLDGQIKDLSEQLRDQRQTVAKQDNLLAHDRDIRELMGARDLYVAEVYDVKRDGSTQKSYGRVFYTKGKSLIFYAYDLDEEPGARDASTFQAWGRRGPDRQEALDLGIFYEDNVAKKRWVLKFDDAKSLGEIDAVFVTVEPKGGSHKPSGKPLLYAYLQLAPNHP
jgi:hypothetical protein